MRKTYYDISLRIKPGWTLAQKRSFESRGDIVVGAAGGDAPTPSRWKDPPHEYFANLMIDAGTVKMFALIYGPLIAGSFAGPGDSFEINLIVVRYMKEQLCRAWKNADARALWFPLGGEESEYSYMPRVFTGPELRPADVWTYMRLLATRDIREKRARYCAKPNCQTPYFVARRNDQKFCSHKCANAVAQRSFRKRRK